MKDKLKFASWAILACIALLIASMATSTVAWYLGATYLEVNPFDVHIDLSNDVKASTEADPDQYLGELTMDDFLNKVELFIPCSSMYSETWQNERIETPLFKSGFSDLVTSNMVGEGRTVRATKGYFSEELRIKSATDCYLLVDPVNSFFLSDEEYNLKKAHDLRRLPGNKDLTEEQIAENLNKIKDSLRVSLLVLNDVGNNNDTTYNYYIIDPYKREVIDGAVVEHETYFGGTLDNDGDGYYDYVNGEEVVYGQVNDPELISRTEAPGSDVKAQGQYTCFNADHYGKADMFDEETSKQNGLEFAKEKSIALQDGNDPEKGVVIQLKKDTPKRVVISIYLEGWDKDNTNMTMYGKFKMKLCFQRQQGILQ